MQSPCFGEILCIARNFFIADYKVIVFELNLWAKFLKDRLDRLHDFFWKGGKKEIFFIQDQCEKKSVLIYKYSATSTKALNQWNILRKKSGMQYKIAKIGWMGRYHIGHGCAMDLGIHSIELEDVCQINKNYSADLSKRDAKFWNRYLADINEWFQKQTEALG